MKKKNELKRVKMDWVIDHVKKYDILANFYLNGSVKVEPPCISYSHFILK